MNKASKPSYVILDFKDSFTSFYGNTTDLITEETLKRVLAFQTAQQSQEWLLQVDLPDLKTEAKSFEEQQEMFVYYFRKRWFLLSDGTHGPELTQGLMGTRNCMQWQQKLRYSDTDAGKNISNTLFLSHPISLFSEVFRCIIFDFDGLLCSYLSCNTLNTKPWKRVQRVVLAMVERRLFEQQSTYTTLSFHISKGIWWQLCYLWCSFRSVLVISWGFRYKDNFS